MENGRVDDITKELPYLIVGGTALAKPLHRIVLTGTGIKEIAKRVESGDRVAITEWQDATDKCQTIKYYQRIEILRR